MGYPTERFPNSVDENLICSICRGVFAYPVVTNCGHTFCYACLDEWLQAPGQTESGELFEEEEQEDTQSQIMNHLCPACRHPLEDSDHVTEVITEGHINSVTVARPVLALRNLVESLPMGCVYASRGCQSVKSVELMEAGVHQSTCAYAPVACHGCGSVVNRSELATHQLMCTKVECETEKDNCAVTIPTKSEKKIRLSNKATQTEIENWFQQMDYPDQFSWSKESDSRTKEPGVLNYIRTANDRTRCSLRQVLQRREQETMEFLNMSLLKLVYALKFELECSQTELKLAKLQVRSSSTSQIQNTRRYM